MNVKKSSVFWLLIASVINGVAWGIISRWLGWSESLALLASITTWFIVIFPCVKKLYSDENV